jgi:hypothetical protein
MAASRRCLLSCLAQTYVYGTRASKEIDVNTRSLVLLAALVVLPWILTAAPPQQITGGPLPWAYGADVPPPLPGGTQPDDSLKHVPGSNLSFTRAQISNAFGPADWHPEDHGPMPDIVAYGRRPQINACALCHYANGKGRAENAGVSGLPVTYFIQQMMEVHGIVLATGVKYNNRFCSIIKIENRKIAHWRDYMDSLAAWNALTLRAR